jgi:hypothetical protein
VCEHIASQVLQANGIPSAATEIHDFGARRFLEVTRYDRTPAGGRRGVITLGALEDAFLAQSFTNWAEAAQLLVADAWISADTASTLRRIWCFGELIANSDMHRANVSFWFSDALPFEVSPVYDMLPMQYRPNGQGEVVPVKFAPRPPTSTVLEVWGDAVRAALEFWDRCGEDSRLSEEFRREVSSNRRVLEQLQYRYGS